jgi:hypothetical protein
MVGAIQRLLGNRLSVDYSQLEKRIGSIKSKADQMLSTLEMNQRSYYNEAQ